MTARKPYVGVTGYTRADQVVAVHELSIKPANSRRIMDGILIWSYDLDPRWRDDQASPPVNLAKRFMPIAEAQRLFASPSDGSLRLIHLRTTMQARLDEQLLSWWMSRPLRQTIFRSRGPSATGENTPVVPDLIGLSTG